MTPVRSRLMALILRVPEDQRRTLIRWYRTSRMWLRGQVGGGSAAPPAVTPAYDVPPAPVPPRTPLRVAVVGDDSVVGQLRAECHVLDCGAGAPSAGTLAGFAPDLLLVASPVQDPPSLDTLLATCADRHVPTLFWDRHGVDTAGAMELAAAVDVVATTRAHQVQAYTAALGHARVHHLRPAAQVDLHNPRQPGDRRSTRMAATVQVHLDEQCPGRFGGGVSPAQFLSLCRMYEAVAVTPANHPDAEQAMVHAAACGAAEAPVVAGVPGVAGHLAHRAVHTSQTWTHHLDRIAGWCNIALPHRRSPRVGVVMCTYRPADAQQQLDWFAALDRSNVDLHLALVTGFDPDDLNLDRLSADRLVLGRQDQTQKLGDHVNRAKALVDADYYAKIDDDDRYGDHYFTDMLLAAHYSRADVLGKHSHYAYVQSSNTTVLRFPGSEHRFTHWVAGGTLFWRANVNDTVQFPSKHGDEDFGFLRRVMERGLRIYATDRFNFTLMRRSDKGSHTWTADDDRMITSHATEMVCTGPTDDVFV